MPQWHEQMKTVGQKSRDVRIVPQDNPKAAVSTSKPVTKSDQLTAGVDSDRPLIPRSRMNHEAEVNTASGFAHKISQLYSKHKRAVAIVGMGVLRVPLLCTAAHAPELAHANAEDLALDAAIANESASENVASEMLFGPPKSGSKPITDGAYHSLLN